MSDAREYLAWGWWSPARQDAMRDALLAVLDECDKADAAYLDDDYTSYREGQFDLSARVAAVIDKALLGMSDD